MRNSKTEGIIKIIKCISLSLVLCFLLFFSFGANPKSSEKELQSGSSSLQKMIEESDDTTTENFVDSNGTIVYAADKHYARKTKKYTGNTLLEEYFDENGNPTEQSAGHYAIVHEYNNQLQEIRRMYLDAEGQPVMLTSGYAVITRTYDDYGRVVLDLYGDVNGRPVCTKNWGYGCQYEYNDNNRIAKITYLNQIGKPEITQAGYAIIERTYYKDGENAGKIENEFYFDVNENPVALSIGQYGLHREYDQLGRAKILTYLDKEGSPIITNRGYTTISRTFYGDNSVKTDMYLDCNGNPIALSHGQYGVKNVDGQKVYLNYSSANFFLLTQLLLTTGFYVVPGS